MIKVLWIAFPQLETQEIKQAMKILGYRPYGGIEVFTNKGHVDIWSKHILNTQNIDWDFIFDKYDVGIEVPCILFYRELLLQNPNLKVIIFDVEAREAYNRYKRLRRLFKLSAWVNLFTRPRKYIKTINRAFYLFFKGNDSSLNALTEYATFLEDVKRIVPPKQLFTFKASDGWQPLCKFLDKEVPNQRFPVHHDKQKMDDTTRGILLSIIRRDAILLIIYISVLIGLFVYLLFFYQ